MSDINIKFPKDKIVFGLDFKNINNDKIYLMNSPLVLDNCLSFDGDSWIYTSINKSVNYLFCDSNNEWTCDVWFKPNGINGLISGVGNTTFGIYVENSNLKCKLRGTESIIETNLCSLDSHAVTVTWDGNKALGYYNGLNPIKLNVGNDEVENNNDGLCDSLEGDLRLYNRFSGDIFANYLYKSALSQDEVYDRYIITIREINI